MLIARVDEKGTSPNTRNHADEDDEDQVAHAKGETISLSDSNRSRQLRTNDLELSRCDRNVYTLNDTATCRQTTPPRVDERPFHVRTNTTLTLTLTLTDIRHRHVESRDNGEYEQANAFGAAGPPQNHRGAVETPLRESDGLGFRV